MNPYELDMRLANSARYTAAIPEVEKRLVGSRATKEELQDALTKAFEELGFQVYGARPEDFAEAIMKASEKAS
jgi:hypothetical protein